MSDDISSIPEMESHNPPPRQKKRRLRRILFRFFVAVFVILFLAFLFRPKDPRYLEFVGTLRKVAGTLAKEPLEGKCHVIEFDVSSFSAENKKKFKQATSKIEDLRVFLVYGSGKRFRFEFSSKKLGETALGQSDRPWIRSMVGNVFLGDRPVDIETIMKDIPFNIRKDVFRRLKLISYGLWFMELWGSTAPARIKEKDWELLDAVRTAFVRIEANIDASAYSFDPPPNAPTQIVPTADIHRQWAAVIHLAADRTTPPGTPWISPVKSKNRSETRTVVARASNGHGFLAEQCGRSFVFLEGTPEEMGVAQGELLKDSIRRIVERGVYALGAVISIESGKWFGEMFGDIERRATPFVPERFFREVDQVAVAAGVGKQEARFGTLLPELFHCSGVAVRGKATKDGRLYHARVLDYMNNVMFQNESCVQVFLPKDKNRWVSFGYSGFVGSVTAMNEHGLSIGELGGAGTGAWDGIPMCFLIREIMENCRTVDEAVALFQNSRRTCEYYYVLSDATREMVALKCTPDEVVVLKPGDQHEDLPYVPAETVLISGGDRAVVLSRRIQEHYGKIDAELLIEIIKRPVAKKENLHNAVFIPEERELRIADAGNGLVVVPACDRPYQTLRLDELFQFYETNKKASR